MLETTKAVNAHREALGYPPLETADKRDLLLVGACAQYGEDRWALGALQDVLRTVPNAEIMKMIEEGDPDCEHSDIGPFSDLPFAEVWREAERRGLLSRQSSKDGRSLGIPPIAAYRDPEVTMDENKTKGLIRLEARKRARTLVSLLENELETMGQRLAKARYTAAYLDTDKAALTCPLPNADFTSRLATETARLDALIQLEAELEIEGDK